MLAFQAAGLTVGSFNVLGAGFPLKTSLDPHHLVGFLGWLSPPGPRARGGAANGKAFSYHSWTLCSSVCFSLSPKTSC